jgi:hypothetical protein
VTVLSVFKNKDSSPFLLVKAKNKDRKIIVVSIQCEEGTPTAMPPAITRKTKPIAIHITSIITSCFRYTEYRRLIDQYARPMNKKLSPQKILPPTLNNINENELTKHVLIDNKPKAMGRFDFLGCFLSLSLSKTSFKR